MYVPKSHIEALKKKIMDIPSPSTISAGSTQTESALLKAEITGVSTPTISLPITSVPQPITASMVAPSPADVTGQKTRSQRVNDLIYNIAFMPTPPIHSIYTDIENKHSYSKEDRRMNGVAHPLSGYTEKIKEYAPTYGELFQDYGAPISVDALGRGNWMPDWEEAAKPIVEGLKLIVDITPEERLTGVRYAMPERAIEQYQEDHPKYAIEDIEENWNDWLILASGDRLNQKEKWIAEAAADVLYKALRQIRGTGGWGGMAFDGLIEEEKKLTAKYQALAVLLAVRSGGGAAFAAGTVDSLPFVSWAIDQLPGSNLFDEELLALKLGEENSDLLKAIEEFNYLAEAKEASPYLYTAGELVGDAVQSLALSPIVKAGTAGIKGFSEMSELNKYIINNMLTEGLLYFPEKYILKKLDKS